MTFHEEQDLIDETKMPRNWYFTFSSSNFGRQGSKVLLWPLVVALVQTRLCTGL